MNSLARLWLREDRVLVPNPGFWATCLFVGILILLYYTCQYAGKDLYIVFPQIWKLKIFEFSNSINGILFYIPFIYAALFLWWRGAVIIWLVSIAIMSPNIAYFAPSTVSLVTNMFYLVFPLIVLASLALEMKRRAREKDNKEERELERQNYMLQIFKAQEEERQRIARELHDDTTHTLLVIANKIQAMLNISDKGFVPQIREQGESIKNAILDLTEDVRRLSLDLHPSILDNLGLVPALRWMIDRVNQDDTTNARIRVKGERRSFTRETDAIIFRFVQEALNNVVTHSKSTTAMVCIEFETEAVTITVTDNGKGFILPKTMGKLTAKGKLGIIGMQERARFLGGTFNMDSELGKGTTVSLKFNDMAKTSLV